MDIEKDELHDWIEGTTAPFDLVASWEQLNSLYKQLEFHDDISDTLRIEEYKWIIKQLNSFQTKLRKELMPCKTAEIVIFVLKENYTPAGKVELSSRRAVAYQKIRQMYVAQYLNQAEILALNLAEQEQEQDG